MWQSCLTFNMDSYQRDCQLTFCLHIERRWAYGTQLRMCLWKRGQKTVKQPVYVGDLAKGIVNSLTMSDSPGKIYEAVGPHRYRLDDLVKWIIFNCRYLPRELNIGRLDPWFL